MTKKCNSLARDTVLDLLKANPNKRYRLKYLSKLFGVSESSVRMVLAEMPANIRKEKSLDARLSYYYVDEDDEKPKRWIKPFTPLKLDVGMKLAMDRCKTDRGGEYHPITIS